VLFHITPRIDWDAAVARGEYRAASLEAEGFIHLSTDAQWPSTLQRFFRGREGLVLLAIDPSRLTHEVRFEAADGDRFPHLYGPLDLGAVIDVRPLALGADGLHRVVSLER